MRTQIKLIGLDLDGTLLGAGRKISPYTLDVLNRAEDLGITAAIVTGRGFSYLPADLKYIKKLRYTANCNGAVVKDLQSGRTLSRYELEPDFAAELMRLDCFSKAAPFAVRNGYYHVGDRYLEMTEDDPEWDPFFREKMIHVSDVREFVLSDPAKLERLCFVFENRADLEEAWKEIPENPDIAVSSTAGTLLDINHRLATKGNALLRIAEELGLQRENVLAIGDDGNDIDMIQKAGIGVAMGNAIDRLKSAADYITETNLEDGAAKAIERLVFSPGEE